MAKLLFTIVAENIVTDSAENKVSIINVLERLNAPEFPAVYPLCYILCVWEKEEQIENAETFNFRLKIQQTGVEEVMEHGPLAGEIPAGRDRVRTIIRLQGLTVRQEGEMNVIVEKQNGTTWDVVGTYPLSVKVQA